MGQRCTYLRKEHLRCGQVVHFVVLCVAAVLRGKTDLEVVQRGDALRHRGRTVSVRVLLYPSRRRASLTPSVRVLLLSRTSLTNHTVESCTVQARVQALVEANSTCLVELRT
jgi:hypothetical protein